MRSLPTKHRAMLQIPSDLHQHRPRSALPLFLRLAWRVVGLLLWQFDLAYVIAKRIQHVKLAFHQGKGRAACELVRRRRLQRCNFLSGKVENEDFIRGNAGGVQTSRLRINDQVLEVPSSLGAPFFHWPLRDKFSIRIENLDPRTAHISYVDSVILSIHGHGGGISKLPVPSSWLSPNSHQIAIWIELHDLRVPLVDHVD